MLTCAFVHDAPPQRVVFAAGAVARIGEEAKRLNVTRALIVATPGSGARLAARVKAIMGGRAAAVHADAVIHVPRAIAESGLRAAKSAGADGLIAVGGGSAIGLAKAVALETNLPILAVPTTYSGSEATPIWGVSEGDRKTVGRDVRAAPRTVIYDPELTFALAPAVTAASAMNAIAHCVEGLWISERTPATMAFATEALRRFGGFLSRAVRDGQDREARAQCLIAAWLAGTVLVAGTALHHKLAHVLGGYGLPHAETHAIILPHVMRFNLAADAASEARERLSDALRTVDPAEAAAEMVANFPIPQRLRDLGFPAGKIEDAVTQLDDLAIVAPRTLSRADARALLEAAY